MISVLSLPPPKKIPKKSQKVHFLQKVDFLKIYLNDM